MVYIIHFIYSCRKTAILNICGWREILNVKIITLLVSFVLLYYLQIRNIHHIVQYILHSIQNTIRKLFNTMFFFLKQICNYCIFRTFLNLIFSNIFTSSSESNLKLTARSSAWSAMGCIVFTLLLWEIEDFLCRPSMSLIH